MINYDMIIKDTLQHNVLYEQVTFVEIFMIIPLANGDKKGKEKAKHLT